ncbi:hypothetical protein M0R45_021062 [Rubus argutus]|uniref:Uncharacterized protein n=1 Tax=Rubus argutus TaxID=59490 RepID=A0AAW1XBJ6_RUBAR
MGVFTYESEFTSVIPPARLFKAFVLDADNLIPKIAPQAVKSTRDSSRRWELEPSRRSISAKELVASSDGAPSSRAPATTTPRVRDVEIKEEHVKAGKERAAGLFKIIESHLLANPDAYN